MFQKIGFSGLGLIGGSMARTIRKYHPAVEMTAYDISAESTTAALEEGIIDRIAECPSDLKDCDLVFIATPVDAMMDTVRLLCADQAFHGIITDVGSVKNEICRRISELPYQVPFIGGHPMAGSELAGFKNSHDHLFENAYYFLTPTDDTPKVAAETLREFISGLNALPVVISPAEHDRIVAAISHLPHLVAASLVNLVRKNDRYDYLKRFCAGGFKDITRIASSSPELWSGISAENREPLLEMLSLFEEELASFRNRLESDEPTSDLFDEAKNYRDTLPQAGKGLIQTSYVIYCDLKDEVGSIAKMANHLYMNDISIKNIAIENSREFQDGALRIELYDEETWEAARKVLTKYQYKIFR